MVEINVGNIYDEVVRAALAVGTSFSELPSQDAKHIIRDLDTKFAEGKGRRTFFWEAMVNSISLSGAESWDWIGWQWLNDFIKNGEVLMWFVDWLGSDTHRDVIIEFRDG